MSHRSLVETPNTLPKRKCSQIDGVAAHTGDHGDAEGKHAREHHTDGRVFFDAASADSADAKGGPDAGEQCADEDPKWVAAAPQIADSDAGQNGVGERVAHKGHAPEHNVGAQHGADNAHNDDCNQPPHHKGEAQWVGEPAHYLSHDSDPLRRGSDCR
jgi:hypothetical protein